MRSILFEVSTLSLPQALLVALVLGGLAALWAWRERRAERLTEREFRQSIAVGIGVAVVAAAALFVASRLAHPIRIRSYGVMLMLAFGAGILIATQRAPLYRVEPAGIVDLSLFILLGSIIGSRVLYVSLNWQQEYASDPRAVLNVWEGGLSFHGGLIGGALGAALFCTWRKVRLSVLADLVAPSIAFGYSIARLGCFLNGCCHGGPTTVPWGVCFPDSAQLGSVHPTQLYSALGMWLMGVALLVIAPRIRVPGHLFLWFLILSSVERIFNEAYRRGYTGHPWGPLPALTQAQAFSVLLIAIAGAVIVATWKRVGYPPGQGGEVTGDREQERPADGGPPRARRGRDRAKRQR